MKSFVALAALASIGAVSAADCPAVGTTNAAGDYSCNPAHQYPGQVCALIGDCYFLRGLGLLTSSSTAPPQPTQTSCPPPGSTNAAGDYSCNPAHQYPNEACVLIGDCYFLRGLGLATSTTATHSGSVSHSSGTHKPTGTHSASTHTHTHKSTDTYSPTMSPTSTPTFVPSGATHVSASYLSAVAGLVALFYALQ